MKLNIDDQQKALLYKKTLAGEFPDEMGRFGPFGGRYIPETLVPAFSRLEAGMKQYLGDKNFMEEWNNELNHWVGRPTALTFAPQLSQSWGANVWLKREDMAHTGAHKINNAIGQAMLAKKLGAKKVIAETGAGQHGVASAAACARVGLPCCVYMGAVDIERQAPNVDRMRQLGADVIAVESGDRTLRAAIDEAMREWVSDPMDTYYIIGSAVGPHPYPFLVREFQSVIGTESKKQMLEQAGCLPDAVFACVGGGSNAIGMFYPLIQEEDIELIGVEAGGLGSGLGQNAASLATGTPGVLQGAYTIILQNKDGQVQETHSISAGLDYSGVGPEHALLQFIDRIQYVSAQDNEALEALTELCQTEGILTALETAHAFAAAKKWASKNPNKNILIGNSGRGDKDMSTLSKYI
ncbi:MAG: tryptophan synthase subunit beta [Gammaproteobacteria bacterium]|nr:tryptophan synthase subunit beta [Gammaproteobacteria bacterium]